MRGRRDAFGPSRFAWRRFYQPEDLWEFERQLEVFETSVAMVSMSESSESAKHADSTPSDAVGDIADEAVDGIAHVLSTDKLSTRK